MADLLNSGQTGTRSVEQQRMIREETIRKWSDLGFLDNLGDETRQNIAQLYEGQASTMINEVTEGTNGNFDNIVFPTVRRVFARLQGLDIIKDVEFKPTKTIKKHTL